MDSHTQIHRVKSVTIEMDYLPKTGRNLLKLKVTDGNGATHELIAFLRGDAEISAFDGWLGDGNDD